MTIYKLLSRPTRTRTFYDCDCYGTLQELFDYAINDVRRFPEGRDDFQLLAIDDGESDFKYKYKRNLILDIALIKQMVTSLQYVTDINELSVKHKDIIDICMAIIEEQE